MNDKNLLFLFVGAIAASIGTFFANLLIEYVRERRNTKTNKLNLSLLLKVVFQDSLKLLDQLKNSLTNQNIFSLRFTGVLIKSINRLENLRVSAYFLQNSQLVEKFFNLTVELSIFVQDIEVLESLANTAQQNYNDKPTSENKAKMNDQLNLIKEQRQVKLIELVDLHRQIEDIVKLLSEIK